MVTVRDRDGLVSSASKPPIFGGPLNDLCHSATATIYVDRSTGMTSTFDLEGAYRYHLVQHDGRRAFVPTDDRDLVAAFHDADADPNGAAATILAAELQRRGIEF